MKSISTLNRRVFCTLPFLLSSKAFAHSAKAGEILIGHAWALPTSLQEGQVFMALANNGKADDALVAARTDIASLVEFRKNNRYDDPALKQFDLAIGKPLPMRPTANHLRLIGLSRPLKIGDKFPLVLDFLNAGELEMQVYVEEKPGD